MDLVEVVRQLRGRRGVARRPERLSGLANVLREARVREVLATAIDTADLALVVGTVDEAEHGGGAVTRGAGSPLRPAHLLMSPCEAAIAATMIMPIQKTPKKAQHRTSVHLGGGKLGQLTHQAARAAAPAPGRERGFPGHNREASGHFRRRGGAGATAGGGKGPRPVRLQRGTDPRRTAAREDGLALALVKVGHVVDALVARGELLHRVGHAGGLRPERTAPNPEVGFLVQHSVASTHARTRALMFAYTVKCTVANPEVAEKWVAWCVRGSGRRARAPLSTETSEQDAPGTDGHDMRLALHHLRSVLRRIRDGHAADVVAAGAKSATLVELDGQPEGTRCFEVRAAASTCQIPSAGDVDCALGQARYEFESRDAFATYELDHAPRLREEGLSLFPLELGLKYERSTGDVLVSV